MNAFIANINNLFTFIFNCPIAFYNCLKNSMGNWWMILAGCVFVYPLLKRLISKIRGSQS